MVLTPAVAAVAGLIFVNQVGVPQARIKRSMLSRTSRARLSIWAWISGSFEGALSRVPQREALLATREAIRLRTLLRVSSPC